MPLRERVEPGAEEHVLADAFLDQQIFDEPGAATMAARYGSRPDGVHVATVAPPVLGVDEGEADLVVDQVRRVVELHVQRARTARCARHCCPVRRS